MQSPNTWPRVYHTRCLKLALLLLALSWLSTSRAEDLPNNSRATGMGSALTAGSSGSAAIWHNPAGVLAATMYAAEAGYAYHTPTSTSGLTASILDTKSNPNFGLGLAFTYETVSRDNMLAREAYHVRMAGAFPLADGFLRLGSTLRYTYLDRADQDVLEALIMDAGLVLQFTDAISLGFTAHNLVNGGYDQDLPLTLSAGLAFAPSAVGLLLSGDVVFDLTTPDDQSGRTWRAGAEYLIQATMPLRVGYNFSENTDASYISAGAGFRDASRAVGFDLGYLQNLDLSSDRSILASLSLYL